MECLNLSDNALGPPGAHVISSYLSDAFTLKYLYINNNGLGWHGGKAIADALVSLSNVCKDKMNELKTEKQYFGLRTVVVGRNRLENEGATELSRAWRAHAATLEEVHMPQNGIRANGIIAISSSLQEAYNLKLIDLQDNTFVFEGSRAFAAALTKWPKLEVLNLNDAYLTDRGCELIIDALKQAPCLASIQLVLLQYNGMKEGNLAQLIPLIPKMTSLKSLQLNGNSFEPTGETVEKLMETLDRCCLTDILDSLSDMEDEDEEESEMESDSESDVEEAERLSENFEEDSLVEAFADLAQDMTSILPPEGSPSSE